VCVAHVARHGEKRFAGDRKEFVGRFGAVGVEHRVRVALDRVAKAPVLGVQNRGPVFACPPIRQRRDAVGDAVAHVQDVRELMDHDVVAPVGRLAAAVHVVPRQHERPAFHRLAAQLFLELMHDADLVDDFALRDDRIGVHDDALETAVPVEAEAQHGQAGLCRDRHRHLVVDGEAVGAEELLLGEKERREFAQLIQGHRIEVGEKGITHQRQLPKRIGNAALAQHARAPRLLPCIPQASHLKPRVCAARRWRRSGALRRVAGEDRQSSSH
jgi:hypothetical protein